MKILIVPSWYSTKKSPNGGVFFKDQALALQEIGLNVSIAYPALGSVKNITSLGSIQPTITKEYESELLTYRHEGINYFPKLEVGKRFLVYKRLKKIYFEYVKDHGKPEIIHAHAVRWGGWAASKIANEYNIPIIITEHSSAYGLDLISKFDEKHIKKALESADLVIAVGQALKKDIQKYIPDKEIKIIPNIIDTNKFKKKQKENNNKFIFFSLAYLNKNKGMDVLIKSFAKAFKGDKATELIIGGEGKEKENLNKLILELGVESQIHLIGSLNRNQVVEQMNNCDVFILTSRHETFGVVYIEALASGKPVIATKCGGPEEIITEDNGLLVEIDNVKEIVDAMLQIKNEYEKYDSEKIMNNCKEIYSSTVISEQLYNIYKEVIKSE